MQSNEISTFLAVPRGRLATVVTSLEMRAPPAPRRGPDLPGLALTRVERPGLDWYRSLFRRIGGDWLWFSRLRMSDEQLAAILEDPAEEVWLLTRDGEAAGLVELDRRQPPVIELAFFGLVREAIGGGVGRWLMSEALRIAWSYGPERLWVHTCTFDHPGALEFYQRSGFTPCALSVEITDDPRLLGVLPESAAPHVPLLKS